MSAYKPAPGDLAVYHAPGLLTVHVADKTGCFQQMGKAEPDCTFTRSGSRGLETLCGPGKLREVLGIVSTAHLALLENPKADLSHMATHTLGRVPGSQRSVLVPIELETLL